MASTWETNKRVWFIQQEKCIDVQFHWLIGVAAMFFHPANHERVLPGGGAADEAL